GLDYTHPDLAANVWSNPGGVGGCAAGTHGYNAISSTCDPMDDDTVYGGHGTHVAGILGAVGDNGIGVAGVNWTTTILPVKWVGSGGSGTTSNLIIALDWLVQAKQAGVNLRVVNDSQTWSGTAPSQALSDEIDLLGQNGILFVTAAGNTHDNNDNPALRRWPCAYERPTEICVTASDQRDALPSWANIGPTTVDLAAPGNNIYSTLRNGAYGVVSGGSMASPQVAGAAALILSVQDMSPQALKADILKNVDPLPSLSGLVRTGGRLDICKALPGCAPPASGVFGQSSIGPNSDRMSADRKRVNHFQLTVAGSVSKLTIYLAPTATTGQQVIEGVIYSDQSGSPGARLAVSTELTFHSADSAGWYDLVFSSPASLQPGVYWIGVISGPTSLVAGFRWSSVSGARAYNPNPYGSGPSDPFGAPTVDSEQMSLYATYSASSSPPPPLFNVTPPSIGGITQEGQTLTAVPGDWTGGPTSFAYQWRRCSSIGSSCGNVIGATSASYATGSADVGSTMQVAVTATDGTNTVTGYSPPSSVVQTTSVSKQNQAVTFTSTAPTGATVSGPTYTPTATASSGLSVILTIDTSAASVCSMTGGVVSFIGAGTCVIDANQPGNATYNPAPQVQQSLAVGKGSQTITFTSTAPTGATVGGSTYSLTATATSGLAVTFTIDSTASSVCSISGSTVSFIGAGTCILDANQTGNANYNAASQVEQSFPVGKGSQTVTFTSAAPTGATVSGPTYTPTATASSGLSVILTIDTSAASV
nr:S8 family serine peptidase [Propionibacteriales bacterium]